MERLGFNLMDMKTKQVLGALFLATVNTMSATEYCGVGVVFLTATNDQPQRIGTVFKGSPAERAGIKQGSVLISVNGTNAVKWPWVQVLETVRGPVGTIVTLGVADPDRTQTNHFTLKREMIVMPGEQRATPVIVDPPQGSPPSSLTRRIPKPTNAKQPTDR
jgi:C-terminal processing protease CtpA/Prc